LQLLKELDRVRAPLEDSNAGEARRDRAVTRMKRLQRDGLRERAQKRKRRTWLAAAAAVFALGALVLGVGLRRNAGADDQGTTQQVRLRALAGLVEVSHDGQTSIVGADTRPLAPEDRVQTDAGALASVFLPSGATFSVGERASLHVQRREPAQEDVRLDLGRIDVHVPKLAKGAGFAVRSTDALVTVHGTRFSVAVQESRPSVLVTTVEVSEGVVVVVSRGKTIQLRGGQRWSSGERDTAAPTAETGSAVPFAEKPAATTEPAPPAASPTGGVHAPSTLGSENELLSQAMSAAAAGDDARALSLLGAFLSKHPRSTLAENAAIARLRVLSHSGNHAGAARAARGYLAQYPEGIGRELARRLATNDEGATDSNSP
jgi:ferric-dicitrate binding protein FerR (iron transport regulator)